jgi:RNase P subunit RPR2
MRKINFTCEHCGAAVPWGRYRGKPKPRNHCPYCLWSKHVAIGTQIGYPPCGAMMRGKDVGNSHVVWRCLGCGFITRGPTDDYLFSALSEGLGSTGDGILYR